MPGTGVPDDGNTAARAEAAGSFGPAALPTITLPKGGGAIRGIGEKFGATPVTGTASASIPIATSPGRAGFGPQLSLSYDSGAGNGPFGFGWSLSLPAITRKTSRGLPRYQDGAGSDVFVLTGSEDLVPVATPAGIADPPGFKIQRYRPRVEGLFARIERWTALLTGDVHWRSITRDNVTTLYGWDAESRIADPSDAQRIFSWLICRSYDDKGNAIVYRYQPEDAAGVDRTLASERGRVRSAGRYLKRIRYGNTISQLADPDLSTTDWLFDVVFDYGEEHVAVEPADAEGRARVRAYPGGRTVWPVRRDPFSSYRAGFEVRTYRLCRRVLMFHRFPDALGVGDYLVRSTDLSYDETPVASFVASAVQSAYMAVWPAGAGSNDVYLAQSLPPLEFEYSKPVLHDQVREADVDTLENFPRGFDGRSHQWVDLDGEGLTGILSEQANGWYYKPNEGEGRFGPQRRMTAVPSTANLSAGGQQLLDLDGDGTLDLAALAGAAAGFYERTAEGGWETFRPFTALPQINWDDQNLRFVDLTGDGRADVLITEADAVRWYPSQGERGFGAGERCIQPTEEDKGPRLLFADETSSVYLADLSGDGLADLVRIRNGDICYWPNLGYGRFGAKVTMDGAPLFDRPDQFDQRRVRLADIDGSGTTDIIYLGRNGVTVHRNLSGNGWDDPEPLPAFPPIDDLSNVFTMDLLGTGTACLVWSSLLPADDRRSLRYVDLMGGQKPHLLVAARNNLGAETRLYYAPSTKFYLADRRAGRPWVTRVPFPVHVVERVESYDLISRNRFVSRYAYHHGYFDGAEREFHGFGMVEQWDTEEFAALAGDTLLPGASNVEAASHVPPLLVKTWFHTGACVDGNKITRQFEREYWREPGTGELTLLADTPLPTAIRLGNGQRSSHVLTDDEVREACRALRGALLRQEVYAVDGGERATRPYSVLEHSYTVELLQARGTNPYAVVVAHPREAVGLHYDRAVVTVGGAERSDPRVLQTATLEVNDFGQPIRTVSVGYGRRFSDADLAALFQQQGLGGIIRPADRATQRRTLITFSDNRLTEPIDRTDAYRAPLVCETRTYELIGTTPAAARPGATNLYTFAELRQKIGQASDGIHDLPYDDIAGAGAGTGGTAPWRRLIQHTRTLYRGNTLTGPADGLLPLGTMDTLALTGESYRLAYPSGLLGRLFRRNGQALIADPVAVLRDEGGYVRSQELKALGLFPASDPDDGWWMPSGRVFYSETPLQELTTARAHFFLPRRLRSPFGKEAIARYDEYDLLLSETEDAAHNRVTVGERDALDTIIRSGNDYRVLAPRVVTDPNRNRTEVVFDTLGMVTATAVMGKPEENLGDTLTGMMPNPSAQVLAAFAADPIGTAPGLLQGASSRIVYDVHRFRRSQTAYPADPTRWEPSFAAVMARETHATEPVPARGLGVRISVAYSDGFGREIQKKTRAEPGPLADGGATVQQRWIASGWAIFNNKGKPVRKYEPFFDDTPRFRFGRQIGSSSVIFYDPVDRVVGRLHADHTWEKVAFDPWHQATWDVNDTVAIQNPAQDVDAGDFFARLGAVEYLPTWAALRTTPALAAAQWPGTDPVAVRRRQKEAEAAAKAAVHAGTPTLAYSDALGRRFLTIAHNRWETQGTPPQQYDEWHPAREMFDIEGHTREVRDAIANPADPQDLGRLVMRYDYDMAGRSVHQASMEAGERWTLADVTGKSIRSWDSRGHTIETRYDDVRRPVAVYLSGGSEIPAGSRRMAEQTVYGEGQGTAHNHRGRVYQVFDGAGLVTHERYDFKGGLERSSRSLLRDYWSQVDWQTNPALLAETFVTTTRFDALGRPTQVVLPYSRATGISVLQPAYNEAGLLERLELWRERSAVPAGLLPSATATDVPVTNVDYDAKGQRRRITYGNGVRTDYLYDAMTFRLLRLVTRRPATGFAGDCPNPPAATALPTRPCGVQNLQYVYDPAGNVTHIYDDAQQPVYYNGNVALPSADYTCDAVYRLIAATGREHVGNTATNASYDATDGSRRGLPQPGDGQAMVPYTEEYRYDPVGNFEALVHQIQGGAGTRWVRRYAYEAPSLLEAGKVSNRLTATSMPGDADNGPYSGVYRYNEHGSVTAMPHLPTMSWDFRDQLRLTQRQVVIGAGGGEKTWYVYDGSGQRVRKVTERSPQNISSERIYLGGVEVYREYSGPGVRLERETLHVMDDSRRVAVVETTIRENGATLPVPSVLVRYQLANHLGSASVELDDRAAIISYEEYYPSGNTSYQAGRSVAEVSRKRYRYTGQERDEESGLNYHGARYYAPWIGRWTSCDPAGFVDGSNIYRYCRNNPVSRIDTIGTDDSWFQTSKKGVIAAQRWVHEKAQQAGQIPLDNAERDIKMAGSAMSPTARNMVRSMAGVEGAAVATVVEFGSGFLMIGANLFTLADALANVPAQLGHGASEIVDAWHQGNLDKGLIGASEIAGGFGTVAGAFLLLRSVSGGVRTFVNAPGEMAGQGLEAGLRNYAAEVSRQTAPSNSTSTSSPGPVPSAPAAQTQPQAPAPAEAPPPAPAPAPAAGAGAPPVPPHVRVIMQLQDVITQQKALLDVAIRSLDEQALQKLGALEGQLRNVFNPTTYTAAYGQLLEGLVRRAVAADPTLNAAIEFTGNRVTMTRTSTAGKVVRGKPDFTGRPGDSLEGLLLDLTTTRGALKHYMRFYGENMVVFTADAPMPVWQALVQ